jgi:dihydroorotate dehydrogenase electron transfer subunit
MFCGRSPLAGIANDRVKPAAGSPRGRYVGRVVSNTRICTDHYKLVLAVPGMPPSAPGQFVQIECADGSTGLETYQEREWSPGMTLADADFQAARAYLRRPFSIAGRRRRGGGVDELDIIHRVVGKGTRWLESLAAGAEVSLLGPLGNGFRVADDITLALLAGGGVGIPPMFYLAEALHRRGIQAIGMVGAQRRDLVPLTISPCSPAASVDGEPVLNATEFGDFGFPTVVTTDDGSMGMKGFVTGALRRLLEKPEVRSQNPVVFCCGPTPMMRATAKVCEEFGVACQVSLEQPMACGMGTCQSCVVRWRGKKTVASSQEPEGSSPNGGDWVYKLTCTDGPVFDAGEIVW